MLYKIWKNISSNWSYVKFAIVFESIAYVLTDLCVLVMNGSIKTNLERYRTPG